MKTLFSSKYHLLQAVYGFGIVEGKILLSQKYMILCKWYAAFSVLWTSPCPLSGHLYVFRVREKKKKKSERITIIIKIMFLDATLFSVESVDIGK